MRLKEGFVAQLVTTNNGGKTLGKVELVADAHGLLFTCPKCAIYLASDPDGTKSGHAVLCWFVGKVPDDVDPKPGRWTPTGTTIDDITLTPSVHLSGPGCGWHGWVLNGEAIV